jgi:hypothetical protein
MAQADSLLEFLMVPLDPPAECDAIDQFLKAAIVCQGGEPILGRLHLVSDHSIGSESSLGVAGRTRRRAKREMNASPSSRQLIICQASVG